MVLVYEFVDKSLPTQAVEIADPLDLLIDIGQRLGQFKSELLQTALLGHIIDVRIHLHLFDIKSVEQKKDQILLDFGTVPFTTLLGAGNLDGDHRCRRILWTNPEIDGADRRSLCLLYTSPSPRDGLLSRMPS